jgi:hypothetical protein
VHGFLVGHDREIAQIHLDGVFEHGGDHALEHVADFFLAQERGFDIDLREFGLAVGTQVFVAEALGDLVIAVVAGHHQQLLEQLGRLRQRKEMAIVHAAGHQVVARAFGRGLGQHRGLDVDKAIGIEELAHFHGHAVTQHQVVLHVGAAQVQHAVRQARGLRQVVVVQLERGRHRRVEHHQFMAQHFDLAALEAFIDRALGARAHQTFDLHAKLVAQAFGRCKHLGAVGVADHLHITFAVAQINKDHAAMVAAAVNPAAQGNGFAHLGFGHQTAIVGAHGHNLLSRRCLEGQRVS